MNRYALLVVGSIVTVIFDQASKIWAIKNLSHSGIVPDTAAELRLMNAYPEGMVIIENLFHFRLAGNPGAAWGIFGNMSDSLRIPFFLVISAIAIGVVVMIYRSADGQKDIAMGTDSRHGRRHWESHRPGPIWLRHRLYRLGRLSLQRLSHL